MPGLYRVLPTAMLNALLTWRAPGGPRARLSILIYHRVLPEPDPLRPNEPDVAQFRWQMQLLARHFRPLPLAEAVHLLQSGRLPPRAVCVTFDDGYADNATLALPILRELNIPATVFIATAFLDGGRMFNDTLIESVRRLPDGRHDLTDLGLGERDLYTIHDRRALIGELIAQSKYLAPAVRDEWVWRLAARVPLPLPDDLMLRRDQVRALHAAGIAIGAHTFSHPILARLDDAAVRAEIVRGVEDVSAVLGTRPSLFAYPNGRPGQDYLARHTLLVRKLGFTAAVSTAWGVATRASDVYQLPRFTPWDRTPTRFLLRLARNLGIWCCPPVAG